MICACCVSVLNIRHYQRRYAVCFECLVALYNKICQARKRRGSKQWNERRRRRSKTSSCYAWNIFKKEKSYCVHVITVSSVHGFFKRNEWIYLPAWLLCLPHIPCNYASINVIPIINIISRNLFVCLFFQYMRPTQTDTLLTWIALDIGQHVSGRFPVRAYGKYLMLTAKQSEFVMWLANRNRFTFTKVLIESMQSGTSNCSRISTHFDDKYSINPTIFIYRFTFYNDSLFALCMDKSFHGSVNMRSITQLKMSTIMKKIAAKITHIILINTLPFIDWLVQMCLHNQVNERFILHRT